MSIANSRQQREQDKFGGTDKDTTFVKTNITDSSGNPISDSNRLPVDNFPSSSYFSNVALGRIEGTSVFGVFGEGSVGEGIANEQVLGDGMTGRYPFPTAAAQMTLVSTSTADDLGGTGVNVILVRGNLADTSELFEAVIMDGTTPVTTTNEYLRVNSIIAVNIGTNKKNVGTITLKNGSDLLAQMNIGKNISRTAVYSTPLGKTILFQGATFTAGKDDSGVVLGHFFLSSNSKIDLVSIEVPNYQNQNFFSLELSPLALPAGSDFEITGYGKVGSTETELSTTVNLLIVGI